MSFGLSWMKTRSIIAQHTSRHGLLKVLQLRFDGRGINRSSSRPFGSAAPSDRSPDRARACSALRCEPADRPCSDAPAHGAWGGFAPEGFRHAGGDARTSAREFSANARLAGRSRGACRSDGSRYQTYRHRRDGSQGRTTFRLSAGFALASDRLRPRVDKAQKPAIGLGQLLCRRKLCSRRERNQRRSPAGLRHDCRELWRDRLRSAPVGCGFRDSERVCQSAGCGARIGCARRHPPIFRLARPLVRNLGKHPPGRSIRRDIGTEARR